MTDCFGVEVTEEEIRRWDVLATTDRGTPNQVGEWVPVMFHGREEGARRVRETPTGSAFWQHNLPIDVENLKGTVIELGCGTGRCAQFVAPLAEEYIGLDLSREVLVWARMRYKTWPNVSFLHSVDHKKEIAELEGACLGVFGVHFFIHQDRERMEHIIPVVGRLLAPGGWFSMDLWTEGRLEEYKAQWQPGTTWTAFPHDRGWLKGLLEENGLRPGEIIQAGELRQYLVCSKG